MLAFAPRTPFENRAAATEIVAAAEKLSVALAARNATAGDEALATIERTYVESTGTWPATSIPF